MFRSDAETELELPFVYIGALRRTGSTLLSEALTQLPYSFIFREPRLSIGAFQPKQDDVELFLEQGLDIRVYARRIYRLKEMAADETEAIDVMIEAFRNELVPELCQHVKQVGVKEIWHAGWPWYRKHFSNLKVLLVGRDPRDIYLSVYHRVQDGRSNWDGPCTPEKLAGYLQKRARKQFEMAREADSMRVKYEAFCRDYEALFPEIVEFLESPLPGLGAVGAFNQGASGRQAEFELHGRKITTKRVERWKEESDPKLVEEAEQFFEEMSDYTAFWGYEK